MRVMRLVMVPAVIVAVTLGMALAQAPQGGPAGQRGGGPPGPPGGGPPGGARRGGPPVFNVTSNAWPDGGEIPMKHAGRGDNRSPAFEFKWLVRGTMDPAEQPPFVQSFAVVLHDTENPGFGRGTSDTLHWMAWDIPATAKGLKEGIGKGDLPDGTKQIMSNVGNQGGYYGPGAGPGPHHHYVFEFYALDTKLNLPNTATRQEVFAAMEGHVVGKSVFVGRFRATP
jgi:Raf kinase inhibitor-like YbhB/YbcL family protein